MTLQEYITYALAKKQIEYHSYDPRAKYQCVDLCNDYITKVWGLEAIIGTDAKDFPERLKTGMEFIKNTTEYLPVAGEIAVWDGDVGGGAGHIAVVTAQGLQTSFKSLDQNWSKPLYITQETHNYNNVRGFIRKKGSMANVTVDSATYEMLVTKATKYDEIVATGYVLKPEHDSIVSEKNKALSEKDARITQLEQVNVDLQSQLTECQSQTLPPPTVGWVENGLTIEITEGNKKTITNYKKE
jgi:hypothetical protein